jgi:malate dehydrogenase
MAGKYLTDSKVAVFGAAGAIGSNMAQELLATGVTSHIVMYDPFEKGLEGAAHEMFHCAFEGATVEYTTDPAVALKGTKYLISSGGAPRKEGMTREDLLKSNCEIARGLGQDIKKHAPDLELGIVIFNPADITGMTALLYSGLAPRKLITLAALDSTRLQTELALFFKVKQDKVTGCRTYGGHGEKMVAFMKGIKVDGKPLEKLMEEKKISADDWKKIKEKVVKGGSNIIALRGRSSFQSPAHQSILMLRALLGGGDYDWPCGVYIDKGEFKGVVMAANTKITKKGLEWKEPEGSPEDMKELRASYEHLKGLRAEAIKLGIVPTPDKWGELNSHLADNQV